MEKVAVPEYDVVPLDRAADDIAGLHILFVNVYAIGCAEGGWVLIDAGVPMSGSKIKSWASARFGKDARPKCIILTHGHFDHAGAARDLATEWGVPVYAHPDEFPFLNGTLSYPAPDATVGGGLMAIMSPLLPRGPIDISSCLRPLSGNGEVPDLPGWKWIHTPGHTAGHVSLFRESDRSLVVGDAFCTTKPEAFMKVTSMTPELHGPPAYFTPDWDSARDSVRKLAALRPALVVPGHGAPMRGNEVERGLQTLAADFDRIARPHQPANA